MALVEMTPSEAVGFLRTHFDTPWLDASLRSGAAPEDRGVYWVILPGDATIWPVRVFVASLGGERHAVWLTYDRSHGRDLEVLTQPDDRVSDAQSGAIGRTRLLLRQDGPGSSFPASPVSS